MIEAELPPSQPPGPTCIQLSYHYLAIICGNVKRTLYSENKQRRSTYDIIALYLISGSAHYHNRSPAPIYFLSL